MYLLLEFCLPLLTLPATRCVMCETPLAVARGTSHVLCEARSCVMAHARLPANHKCAVCTRPLGWQRIVQGVCDDASCEHASTKGRSMRSARVAWTQLIARAARRRDRSGAQRGLSPETSATYVMAVLPQTQARTSALPTPRKRAYALSLRAVLAQARDAMAEGRDEAIVSRTRPAVPAPTALEQAESALYAACCAACRGDCCGNGGTHAYLRTETLVRYLRAHPAATDDAVVDDYLAFVQPRTITGACVNQGEQGCTLPQPMRSEICNRYLCAGIKMLKGAFDHGEPVRAFLVHRSKHELRGGRFVQLPVLGTTD